MPKQTSKSSLSAKLGQKGAKAVEAHKDDDVKFSGGGQLPAGVTGIAKVKVCKFDTYEKGEFVGEYYYMASAIVMEPKEFRGMRTSIGPEPMCATPKKSRVDEDAHIAFVLNEYRKLGIDTKEVGIDDLEPTAAEIQGVGIYTRFRTYSFPKQEIVAKDGAFFVGDKKYKTEELAKAANPYVGTEPRVNQEWTGVCEYEEDTTAGGVEDDTAADETEVEAESEEAEEESTEVEVEEESSDDAEEDEISSLAEKAMKKDKKAQASLTKMATEAGVSKEDIEAAEDWNAVAQLIRDTSGEVTEETAEEEAEDETAEEEEWKPAKEEVYHYKAVDPKDPKKRKKIEVEVMSVSEKNETVTLKNLDSQKTILGKDKKPLAIKWSDLIRDE